MIAAGRLRERVDLQDPPRVDDAAGGQTGGWTTIARGISAEVLPLGGSEAALAGVETGIVRYRVTMRRRAISTSQRLAWEGLALDIRAVLPDVRRASVELLCEAVPA